MKPTLVTGYVNPDLDCISCSVAYAELLGSHGDAVAGIFGEPLDEAKYVCERFGIQMPAPADVNACDGIVIVDTSNPEDLDDAVELGRVVEIIDHRRVHQAGKFANAKAQIEQVGSCATLVAERFQKEAKQPSKASAILLYGAVLSNTVLLKNKLTTDRDRAMAAWLQGIAGLSDAFAEEFFRAKSDLVGERLRKQMVNDASDRTFGTTKVVIAQIETIDGVRLIAERLPEMKAVLAEIKDSFDGAFTFLNIVDAGSDRTHFVATDVRERQRLSEMFGLAWKDGVASLPGLMMRKEIGVFLKHAFETGN